ncbi:MAG: hypothetical protein COA60_002695, partial [Robiginitomaculum sp.]|nr:hypothetical protein [Robiginitomaculum sp.]
PKSHSQLVALVEDDVVSDKQERIELMIQTISELEPDEITLLELRFLIPMINWT